jgi:hypothetical protein
MFSHSDPEEDNIWLLEPNTHYYGELCVGEFTTKFTDDFFMRHSSDTIAAQFGDNSDAEDEWRQYMEQISSMPPPQREVAGFLLPPLPDDLTLCTLPLMERQVAMSDQEIADLLQEQIQFQEQFQVKTLS